MSISVTNKYGDVFTNLTVVQILADGLLLENKAGQAKVKFESLPPNLRVKYEPLAAEVAKKADDEVAAKLAANNTKEQIAAEQAKIRELKERRTAATLADQVIDIPEHGLKIVTMNPGLVEINRRSTEDGFIYNATNEEGFTLSILVMNPGQPVATDEDVFRQCWARMSELPGMDPQSVRPVRMPKFIQVASIVQGVPNMNFYFICHGKWVDVRIAKSPHTLADAQLFNDFSAHLEYY